ncbi:MAG: hypothetical protein HQ514_09450, partial [Rhodospirillales bacterium]|nr:hypothetical protein [Rhodospirillales bacterium]
MKQNPFQAMITKAMAAVLCAALWHGAVQAADPVADYMLYYSGERDFCLHLLKNADKAEKIAPVIGPTYAFNLDVGERHAPKTRLYFVKSPMPGPFIYRMRKERNWKAILGYTPWEADSTAGRIVYDSRWRKYDDQCPGLFQIRDYRDPNKIADTPTQMSLYDFDADGDGKHDMIYR